MATVSSLGVGTGIDLQSMLTKIVAAERAPITTLDGKIAAANSKISLYGSLKSKLDALKSAADTLQFPSRLSAIGATSSDATVLTASASFTAAVGSYTAKVTQLASAQKSFSVAYSAGTTFGVGDLSFTVGGVAQDPISLTNPAGSTLQEVATAINDKKIGVTATVITASNGDQRMVLTGDKTGSGNGFSLVSTATPSGSQASLDSFDTVTTSLNRSNAQDGTLEIDGIEVSSSTNSFTSSISGLTLTAVKLGTTTVNVQYENTKITDAVKAFVSAYNDVTTLVKSNSAYNAATKTGQPFMGDFVARGVLEQLGSLRTSTPTELEGAAITTLGQLGISIEQSGQLSLDTNKLAEAIAASPADVTKALNAYGKAFNLELTNMLGSGGSVASRIDSLNSAVARHKDSQAALEIRVALVEKRYRAQFTALDKFVSSMQTISSSLTQQLATLPK